MPDYAVALWVKYSNGTEDRFDTFVHADDKEDAVEEAKGELSNGCKVIKVISVEKR